MLGLVVNTSTGICFVSKTLKIHCQAGWVRIPATDDLLQAVNEVGLTPCPYGVYEILKPLGWPRRLCITNKASNFLIHKKGFGSFFPNNANQVSITICICEKETNKSFGTLFPPTCYWTLQVITGSFRKFEWRPMCWPLVLYFKHWSFFSFHYKLKGKILISFKFRIKM